MTMNAQGWAFIESTGQFYPEGGQPIPLNNAPTPIGSRQLSGGMGFRTAVAGTAWVMTRDKGWVLAADLVKGDVVLALLATRVNAAQPESAQPPSRDQTFDVTNRRYAVTLIEDAIQGGLQSAYPQVTLVTSSLPTPPPNEFSELGYCLCQLPNGPPCDEPTVDLSDQVVFTQDP